MLKSFLGEMQMLDTPKGSGEQQAGGAAPSASGGYGCMTTDGVRVNSR